MTTTNAYQLAKDELGRLPTARELSLTFSALSEIEELTDSPWDSIERLNSSMERDIEEDRLQRIVVTLSVILTVVIVIAMLAMAGRSILA